MDKHREENAASILEGIDAVVRELPPEYQKRVLEFARRLAEWQAFISSLPKTPLPPGTPGHVLANMRFNLSLEDAQAMERALEDCERIDTDEDDRLVW